MDSQCDDRWRAAVCAQRLKPVMRFKSKYANHLNTSIPKYMFEEGDILTSMV
jgi:hypothetical protein